MTRQTVPAGQPVRWGIIGVGDVAEVKSGPGFQKAPGSELRAVMRRDASKAENFARRHQVPSWHSDAAELLARDDIDAVYIATPPASHKDYVLAALSANKSVYVEKPVALNSRECDAMLTAQAQHQGLVCAAHYRRYLPAFVKARELIAGGAIGTPRLARIEIMQPAVSSLVAQTQENWRIDPAVSGGGLFHDLAPHQLDLMLHWFGGVTDAGGIGVNQTRTSAADDGVAGWATLADGVLLQGLWHFAVPENCARDQCDIIGSSGSLSLNFFGDTVLKLKNEEGEQALAFANPPHVQQPMIEQVNAYFRGERDNPCSLEQARDVLALMDQFTGRQ